LPDINFRQKIPTNQQQTAIIIITFNITAIMCTSRGLHVVVPDMFGKVASSPAPVCRSQDDAEALKYRERALGFYVELFGSVPPEQSDMAADFECTCFADFEEQAVLSSGARRVCMLVSELYGAQDVNLYTMLLFTCCPATGALVFEPYFYRMVMPEQIDEGPDGGGEDNDDDDAMSIATVSSSQSSTMSSSPPPPSQQQQQQTFASQRLEEHLLRLDPQLKNAVSAKQIWFRESLDAAFDSACTDRTELLGACNACIGADGEPAVRWPLCFYSHDDFLEEYQTMRQQQQMIYATQTEASAMAELFFDEEEN
jgi:hypothetical protein